MLLLSSKGNAGFSLRKRGRRRNCSGRFLNRGFFLVIDQAAAAFRKSWGRSGDPEKSQERVTLNLLSRRSCQ